MIKVPISGIRVKPLSRRLHIKEGQFSNMSVNEPEEKRKFHLLETMIFIDCNNGNPVACNTIYIVQMLIGDVQINIRSVYILLHRRHKDYGGRKSLIGLSQHGLHIMLFTSLLKCQKTTVIR